ncbi:MAG: hypothetical protein N4A33_01625 [Bacteriovoracaceae bacterium]|jgi:hypothetical protein|nr:hypothetical protein [Bacteriovoracaceae bacterium]
MKILISLIALVSLNVSAEIFKIDGVSDGGGGRGVVCKNTDGSIASVELLDFFEGKNLEGYTIPERTGDYHTIIQNEFVQKTTDRPHLSYLNKEWLPKVKNGIKILPPGFRLQKVEDSGEIFNLPSNCTIEQLANFQGISRVFIVGDFWDKMSETSKAGLVVHELLWFFERFTGVETSSRTRRTVARYFASDFQFANFDFSSLKVGDIACESLSAVEPGSKRLGSVFFIHKRNNDHFITFSRLNGAMLHQPHVVEMDTMSWTHLVDAILNDDYGTSMQFFVTPINSNVDSHMIDLEVTELDLGNGISRRVTQIKSSNFEFPGYDDENFENMECNKLSQEDLNLLPTQAWW